MTERPDAAASERATRGRIARVLLILAAVFAAALIVAGFVVPMYSSSSSSSDGTVQNTSETLVGVNGLGVLLVLTIPLLITLGVGSALRWGTSARRLGLAWALTGGLAALTLLAMLSIGVFLLPVTALLIAATIQAGRQRSPAGVSPR